MEIPNSTGSRRVEAGQMDAGGARPVESLRAGESIGQFLVQRKLGEGAMGEVWLAKDELLDREVAIKVLPDDLRHDPDRMQRFEREAKLMAKLHHPHTVTMHHFGNDKNLFYMVMEYVSGGSLEDRVIATGALPWRDATRAIRDAASGLAEAHRLGLIHRDIKPANLLYTIDGATKVGDFGLARPVLQKTQLTQQGGILGTPSYMSPEQWDGKPADARSDLYALICSYYYLLTGAPPFDADNWLAMGLLHKSQPFPDPRSINPEIPALVLDVLVHGAHKSASDRYQSADELVDKLNAILEPPPKRSTLSNPNADQQPTVEPVGLLNRRHAQRRRLLQIGAGIGALLLIVGIVYFSRKRRETDTASTNSSSHSQGIEKSALPELNPDKGWLRNPGCEEALIEGRIPEWTVVKGNWVPRRNIVHSGYASFYAGESPTGEMFQDVDIETIATQVAAESVRFDFECFIHTLQQDPPDTCRIVIELRDSANQKILTSFDTGEQRNVKGWRPLNLSGVIQPETGWIRVRMLSRRYGKGTRNLDAYYDDLTLRLLPHQ
jgi:serine/threonine protein kinase